MAHCEVGTCAKAGTEALLVLYESMKKAGEEFGIGIFTNEPYAEELTRLNNAHHIQGAVNPPPSKVAFMEICF